jgi:hypothetical protein
VRAVIALSTEVPLDRFTLPSLTFACSGPGATALIEANTATGFTHAAFGFILLLATVALYFLPKKRGLLIIVFSAAVLAVHPAWTIGARLGDCGIYMVSVVKYSTGALGAGFLLQLLLWFVALPELAWFRLYVVVFEIRMNHGTFSSPTTQH